MKFFKKWGILLVTILFSAAIAVLIVINNKSLDEMRSALEARDAQIVTMESSLINIGPLSHGYVLNTNVRAGEKVKAEYFTEVSVPEQLGLGIIKDLSEIEDCYFRVSLKEGTVITTDNINSKEIQDSQRYMDIVLDQLPIGIQEGDVIDIRIIFPYGEDFICLASKEVLEINNSILKLILNENEIAIYNSMLLDRVLYNGTQIYAVTYVDAGSQDVAEAFYPINTSQSELLLQNPNALEISKQEMILKRQMVEETLGGGISEKTEAEIERLTSAISSLRSRTQDRIASANEVIAQRRAEEKARENGEQGAGSSAVEF